MAGSRIERRIRAARTRGPEIAEHWHRRPERRSRGSTVPPASLFRIQSFGALVCIACAARPRLRLAALEIGAQLFSQARLSPGILFSVFGPVFRHGMKLLHTLPIADCGTGKGSRGGLQNRVAEAAAK